MTPRETNNLRSQRWLGNGPYSFAPRSRRLQNGLTTRLRRQAGHRDREHLVGHEHLPRPFARCGAGVLAGIKAT